MSKSLKHGKLVIVAIAAFMLLAVWISISFVSVRNNTSSDLSYIIEYSAGKSFRESLGPGERRYVHKFLSEGGLRIQATAEGRRECSVNIYTVPPLGGKCEIRIDSEASKCVCRLGL